MALNSVKICENMFSERSKQENRELRYEVLLSWEMPSLVEFNVSMKWLIDFYDLIFFLF